MHLSTNGLISNDCLESSLTGWAKRAVLQSFVNTASTENMATFGLHRICKARETYRALSCKPLNILNTQAFCVLIHSPESSVVWDASFLFLVPELSWPTYVISVQTCSTCYHDVVIGTDLIIIMFVIIILYTFFRNWQRHYSILYIFVPSWDGLSRCWRGHSQAQWHRNSWSGGHVCGWSQTWGAEECVYKYS